MVINMFKDQPLECTPDELRPNVNGTMVCPIPNGNIVMENMGIQPDWYWLDQSVVFVYTLAFAVATLVVQRFVRYGSR